PPVPAPLEPVKSISGGGAGAERKEAGAAGITGADLAYLNRRLAVIKDQIEEYESKLNQDDRLEYMNTWMQLDFARFKEKAEKLKNKPGAKEKVLPLVVKFNTYVRKVA